MANVVSGSQLEICNAADDDCNGQADEMNPNPTCTQQNPNAQFVQGWACTSGACQLLSCPSGHANIDLASGNGCECVTDAYQNVCSLSGTSSVPAGGSMSMIGKIESASGRDCLTVSPDGSPYHPKIALSDSAGGQYAVDVWLSCSGAAACSTTSGVNNDERHPGQRLGAELQRVHRRRGLLQRRHATRQLRQSPRLSKIRRRADVLVVHRHGDPSVDAVRLRAVTALHADPQGAIGAA